MNIERTSIIILLLVIFLSGCKYGRKGYNEVTDLITRSGEEAYEDFWGKSDTNCVKILHFQDQYIPKIDYAIWLHFSTCPIELDRILATKDYEFEIASTEKWNTSGPLANDNWFKPESLGDSVLVFTVHYDKYGSHQKIYSNFDSTEVYCIDVFD